MLLAVAFSAILLPLVLVVVLRMSARRAMPLAALAVALLASAQWGVSSLVLSASALQGIHRALTILWILFGALLFLYVMQATGASERIKQWFMKVTPDMRVQTVIVAFAFIAMLEGVSGFGTPAAIAVPLLIALGFHPMTAVVLALIGDSVPTSFGAVGTPLLVGLENVPSANLHQVGMYITYIDALFGLLLPTVLVAVLVWWFGRKSERGKDIWELLPWTLLVGLVYVATSMVSVRILGIEFVSIISGAVALAFALVTARKGILQPKAAWRHHASEEEREVHYADPTSSLFKAWLPYVLVVGILLAQRVVPFVREALSHVADLGWYEILGIPNIHSVWMVLMSPGSVLVAVAIVTILLYRLPFKQSSKTLYNALRAVSLSTLALIPTLIMVQIFVNSGLNSAGVPSMPNYIAETFAKLFGPVWLAVSPVLGTLTAFIMGSSTVSTLTMSPVQAGVAAQVGIPLDVAMAQHISGANAGNIIAIHNVVAASTVAELHHQEGRIIRHTLVAVVAYLACAVVSALIVISFVV